MATSTRTTCPKRFLDLPEDVLARILGHLDLKDRVCAVSSNQQLAALGGACTWLWEEVDFPDDINPGTAAAWVAAKRSTVRKADLRSLSAACAVYLLTALAGGSTEELSISLVDLTTCNPNVLQLPRLRKLSIQGGLEPGLGLQGSFSLLRHLTSLQLNQLCCTSERSLSLGGLTELQELNCDMNCDLISVDLDLAGLSQATCLSSLTLTFHNAKLLPEAFLPPLPRLQQLSISGRAGSRLAHATQWEGFTQLTSLTLACSWSQTRPVDVVPLIGLPRLQALDVSGSRLQPLPPSGVGAPITEVLQRLTVPDAWLADNLALLDCLPAVKLLHLTGDIYGPHRARDAQWDALLTALALAVPSLERLEVDAYKTMAGEPREPRVSFQHLIVTRPGLHIVCPRCH